MSLLKKIKRYSVFYFVASLCIANSAYAQVFNKIQLQEMAINYVANQISDMDEKRIKLSALPLDSRIPDRSCNTQPDVSSSSTPPFNRQITTQVKCNDPQGWAQYVNIKVVKLAPVVVTTANLARGEIITNSHLKVEMQPIHFVRVQYLDNPKLLIGSRSKRNIREGLPILLNQICMVCKGDSVNIYASLKGLKIKTTGIALEDGTLGEQILVENKKTGKVLNVRVDGVESVQVNI